MYIELAHYLLLISALSLLGFQARYVPWMLSFGFVILTCALFGGVSSYLASDFASYNTWTSSNIHTPLLFKVSATWSNHEGSLLLWCWLLGLNGFLCCYYVAPRLCVYSTYALNHGSSSCVDHDDVMNPLRIYRNLALFFTVFLLLTSNPFLRMPFLCVDSAAELNPVLQDPILAIHPPCIYAGYVASAVVFCLSLSIKPAYTKWRENPSDSASIIGFNQLRKSIDSFIRLWMLLCWCFLTIGILLGSWWAYHELGWGGWWFWDPVENASLMPWLLATACIHSASMPRLQTWTLTLGMLTFLLSLVGTFFVRSGLLASVHSFATDSTRGIFLLCLVVSCLIALMWNLWSKSATLNFSRSSAARWRACGRVLRTCFRWSSAAHLDQSEKHEHVHHRKRVLCPSPSEGRASSQRASMFTAHTVWTTVPTVKLIRFKQVLQLQNVFFATICVLVLCGTAAPIMFQLCFQRDVSTGAPFFNATVIPLFSSLLLMMLYVHWDHFRPRLLFMTWRTDSMSLFATVVLVALLIAAQYAMSRSFYQLGCVSSLYALACVCIYCGILAQHHWPSCQPITSLRTWCFSRLIASQRFIARNLAHMGVACFLIGVVLSNQYKLQLTRIFMIGDQYDLGTSMQRCCLRSIDHNYGPTFHSISGNLMVYNSKTTDLSTRILPELQHGLCMFPEKRCFLFDGCVTKVAIHTNLFTDFYLSIGTGTTETGWYTSILKIPFIFCIWIGFMITAMGGAASLIKQWRLSTCSWI